MTSYVGMFLKVHHADGTAKEIADSIVAMLADNLVPEPECPVDLEVEYDLEEVAGERPRGTPTPNQAKPVPDERTEGEQ